MGRTEPQATPWIVYTCGPMGAGKGHVLSWMSKSGYFPLEHARRSKGGPTPLREQRPLLPSGGLAGREQRAEGAPEHRGAFSSQRGGLRWRPEPASACAPDEAPPLATTRHIVHVDPDHFKRCMPEWTGYSSRSDRAGALCHLESGFMQEIAQEVAMRNSQNVWIDGSLRDGPWFAKVFKDLRARFPRYQIAIFEIGASEPVVRARIKERARMTGRDVPEHLIVNSLKSVASSLELLTPLVDFVARISNDLPAPNPPQLRAYIRVDHSGNWGEIGAKFARPYADLGARPQTRG